VGGGVAYEQQRCEERGRGDHGAGDGEHVAGRELGGQQAAEGGASSSAPSTPSSVASVDWPSSRAVASLGSDHKSA
jgi:hypothetical protein